MENHIDELDHVITTSGKWLQSLRTKIHLLFIYDSLMDDQHVQLHCDQTERMNTGQTDSHTAFKTTCVLINEFEVSPQKNEEQEPAC